MWIRHMFVRSAATAGLATFFAMILTVGAPAVCAQDAGRVGPVSVQNGYPVWYQDRTGLVLEFCGPRNQAELDGGWCLLLPGDTTVPEGAPGNGAFADEHFYWAGDADATVGNTKALLVLALEAAFAADAVVPGDQIVFGRLRIRVDPLPSNGTYTVYTPFGKYVFPDQQAGERLFFTEDIGIQCAPGQFECALNSSIKRFLLPSNEPGGAEIAPVSFSGKLFIASPDRSGPVTGSSLPNFVASDGQPRNHNIFRVEGPDGFATETYNFSLMGRLYSGTIAGRVNVERANYALTNAAKQLDVYTSAYPAMQGRIPPQPVPEPVSPVLAFYGAPCSVDPLTGALGEPEGVPGVQMFGSGDHYWGQDQPASLPTHVCVEDYTSVNAAGQLIPTFFEEPVTDEVTISEATYDPANDGTLTVRAVSSDEVNAPVLTLGEYETDFVAGVATVTPLAAPPSRVTVTSSLGGLSQRAVKSIAGARASAEVPVAVNDEVGTPEDTQLTIEPLLNDSYAGVTPIVMGPGVTMQNKGGPFNGTAVFNANGTITYTPGANWHGIDGIAYAVSVNNVMSPTAYITIDVASVSDGAPVVSNDSASAVVNTPKAISVLANDSDPDGPEDIVGLSELTLGPLPAGVTTAPTLSDASGVVTFTAFAPGTYTFTYKARDASNLLSATAATVTVTVSGSEVITVVRAQFRAGDASCDDCEWRVEGTDSLPAGQTLEIRYADGSYRTAAGTSVSVRNMVVATVVVDGLGNFAFRSVVGNTGVLNPSNTGGNANGFWVASPRNIRVVSPLTGASTQAPLEVR